MIDLTISSNNLELSKLLGLYFNPPFASNNNLPNREVAIDFLFFSALSNCKLLSSIFFKLSNLIAYSLYKAIVLNKSLE